MQGGQPLTYDLMAVTNHTNYSSSKAHSDGLDFGHYYAYAQWRKEPAEEDPRFYEFNCLPPHGKSGMTVLHHAPTQVPDKSAEAYVLFYCRSGLARCVWGDTCRGSYWWWLPVVAVCCAG